MKVRGQRECTECGTRWSYYDTGEVACPECGSIRSTGVDERTRHTDAPVDLDLTEPRNRAEEDLTAAAETAAERCREFVRRTGFINAGELRPLSDRYLAAAELAAVGAAVGRAMRTDDDEELYLLSLLRGADAGDRPDPEEVPASLAATRTLAYASAVDDYRRDVRTYLKDDPHPEVQSALESIRDHVRRIEALDGEVDVRAAERLVRSAREVGQYLAEGDEAALAAAQDRLDAL
jgi:uncharacterized Zn finger protein (UPF0148 family)